jgi:aminoglycoside phosphotransferase (APT) family kinase protein
VDIPGLPAHEWVPIAGMGTVNKVYRVGSVIVRLNHDREPERALEEYEKEAWCLAAAFRAGVPSPEVLDLGMVDGRAYMVQTFIPGPTGDEQSWPDLGRLARIVHGISPEGGPATLFDRGGASILDGWRRQLDYNLGQLQPDDPLIALKVYRPDHQPELRRRIEVLPRALPVGLVHGDLAPRNLLYPPGSPPVLIDWGCATAGVVPFDDLVAIARDDERGLRPFCEGYGIPWDEVAKPLENMLLLKSLDLVRWAIDRCPARIEELAEKARLVACRVVGQP